TRARERLLLSASVKPKQLAKEKDGKVFVSPFDFLLASTNGELAEEGEHDCGSYRTRVHILEDAVTSCTRFHGGAMLAESCPELRMTRAHDHAFAGGVPRARQRPLSLRVTELLAYERCPLDHRFSHLLEIPEHAPRRARVRGEESAKISPVELGTVVHGLLERARFDAPDTSAEVLRLLVDQPPELHGRLTRMLGTVLDGDIGRLARAAVRVEREWQFAFRVAGVLVEGVIDLALQDE